MPPQMDQGYAAIATLDIPQMWHFLHTSTVSTIKGMHSDRVEHAVDKISRLAEASKDLVSFWRDATEC